jgi:hypothetical protein
MMSQLLLYHIMSETVFVFYILGGGFWLDGSLLGIKNYRSDFKVIL